jgi:hypothetical protein
VLAAAAVAAASPAHAADAPRLQTLVARAPLVVAAHVSEVETLDAGRLAVATLDPTAVPKGERPASALRVVETRDMPAVPPSLEKGMLVLAFLEPLHRNSYFTRILPQGDYRQLMAGRIGRLVAATPAELAEIVAVVERILDVSRKPEPDTARREAAARALVFDEIAARSPVLVEDGAGGLQMIPNLAESLSEDERQRLATAIGRTDLPPPPRAALVRAVGSNGLRQLVPALQSLRSPAAPVWLRSSRHSSASAHRPAWQTWNRTSAARMPRSAPRPRAATGDARRRGRHPRGSDRARRSRHRRSPRHDRGAG